MNVIAICESFALAVVDPRPSPFYPREGTRQKSPPLQYTSGANRTASSPLKRHFDASTRTYIAIYPCFFPFSRSTSPFCPRGGDAKKNPLSCRVQVVLKGQHRSSSSDLLMPRRENILPLFILFSLFQDPRPRFIPGGGR